VPATCASLPRSRGARRCGAGRARWRSHACSCLRRPWYECAPRAAERASLCGGRRTPERLACLACPLESRGDAIVNQVALEAGEQGQSDEGEPERAMWTPARLYCIVRLTRRTVYQLSNVRIPEFRWLLRSGLRDRSLGSFRWKRRGRAINQCLELTRGFQTLLAA